MAVQAVLLAGDRGASRAVRGESKAYLEIAGKPMLVHVLEALLHTPEVHEDSTTPAAFTASRRSRTRRARRLPISSTE